MSFQARCPECRGRVTANPVLGDPDLDRVLENDGDVEVVCFNHEHRWKLNKQDKVNLRKERQRQKKVATA